MSSKATAGGCLALAVLLPAIGLIISGMVIVLSNRCFFRQFPPAGCNQADLNPPGAALGWGLAWAGAAVLGLITVIGFAARAASKRKP